MRTAPSPKRSVTPPVVVSHFERLADAYHESAFGGAGMAVVSSLDLRCVGESAARARDLGGRGDLRACDVGVGTGRVGACVEAMGFELTGLDVSLAMLGEARSRLSTRSLVQASLADGLPLPDAAFDLVTCMRVLKYLPDWPAALVELARLARPGGVVCFDLANRRSAARFGYPSGLVWPTTHGLALRAIEAAGLEVVAEDPGVHLPDPIWRAASRPVAARALQGVERVASRLVARHGARSWAFVTRRSDARSEGDPQQTSVPDSSRRR